jgi:hypothetical protein
LRARDSAATIGHPALRIRFRFDVGSGIAAGHFHIGVFL